MSVEEDLNLFLSLYSSVQFILVRFWILKAHENEDVKQIKAFFSGKYTDFFNLTLVKFLISSSTYP